MNKIKIIPNSLPPLRNSTNSKPAFPQNESSAIGINRISLQQNQNIPPVSHPAKNAEVPSSPLYTCRICLQEHPALHANNQDQLKNMLSLLEQQAKLNEPKHLITACRCHGTAGYVHQKCMIQWIDAQYKRSKEKQMKCQICLAQILYDRKIIPYFEFSCKNLEDISACNIACITSVVLILALFVVLQTQAITLKFNELTKLTIYILIAILTVTMGISLAMIVKQAFYKTKKQTIKVYSNDEIDICGILKDNLTHYDRRSSTHMTQTNARSVRSARSARDIDRSRVNQRSERSRGSRNYENIQNSHRQRSQRPSRTNTEARQSNSSQPIRSQRAIRSARNITSTRTIQVRSREHIEQSVQN